MIATLGRSWPADRGAAEPAAPLADISGTYTTDYNDFHIRQQGSAVIGCYEHDQGVLDGFGHVSLRHPRNPERYLLSCSRAPELVCADDIMEFDLDSNPVDQRGRSMYL